MIGAAGMWTDQTSWAVRVGAYAACVVKDSPVAIAVAIATKVFGVVGPYDASTIGSAGEPPAGRVPDQRGACEISRAGPPDKVKPRVIIRMAEQVSLRDESARQRPSA